MTQSDYRPDGLPLKDDQLEALRRCLLDVVKHGYGQVVIDISKGEAKFIYETFKVLLPDS
jgi:hypothetical protein